MNYKKRIHHLRNFIQLQKLEGIFISNPTNLIYFSGFKPLSFSEREAYLLITKKNAYIFTSKLYSEEVKKYILDYQLIELSSEYSSSTALAHIIKKEGIASIGFEEHNLTYAEYYRLSKKIKSFIPKSIDEQRIIKDTEEVTNIENACQIGDKAFEHIYSFIKPGISEKELSFELEKFIRSQNAAPSFPTIIAFGDNAAIPHHVTGERILEKNEFVLMDFGVLSNFYCSDMTRTVFVGKPSPRQLKTYNTVLESQQKAIDFIQKSYEESHLVNAKNADLAARTYIIEKGFPSFPHSLGHGIGLQVHEYPSLSPYSTDTLTEGMVFSIEPGIYIPGEIGVRIEDLATLTKEHMRLLTKSHRTLLVI